MELIRHFHGKRARGGDSVFFFFFFFFLWAGGGGGGGGGGQQIFMINIFASAPPLPYKCPPNLGCLMKNQWK